MLDISRALEFLRAPGTPGRMSADDQERIAVEVRSRVHKDVLARAAKSEEAFLDNLIHEVLYFEQRRIERLPYRLNQKRDRAWLASIRSRFGKASEAEKRRLVEEIVDHHVREIVGHFSEPVYQFSTTVLPVGLGFMLSALSPVKLVTSLPNLPDVSRNVRIDGEVEQIRKLDKLGTVVLVPTHQSNVDSPLMGWAIYHMGLPPFTYGAGLNLFHHKIIGFFMHRLGAYKVDRLKQHSLYKQVLKEYATVTIEAGYHNLFFPGGTRSRSGAVERHLKLGLMGCGLNAYLANLRAGKPKPNVYVVPCTINYQIVLEAENLIDDYLKDAGKSRYIIEDDEFSMPSRIYSFLRNIVTLDDRIYLRVSPALDPFGNRVDDEGRSLDGRGRVIDTRKYLQRRGEYVDDADRDREFTRELGERVVESFVRDTVIQSTHTLAFTVFERIRRESDDPDFFRFLRETPREVSVPLVEVHREVDRVLALLRDRAGAGDLHLAGTAQSGDATALVNSALRRFGGYHTQPVLYRRGDRLFVGDMKLLYYYRNRLFGYGIGGPDT
ncbi:1-acyl-sn-glycerol-3-phosphate acyltransferase [bacterium]|nr:1-acyl-sn-glycerol-3-phosphate acyltransferase [bacterium]